MALATFIGEALASALEQGVAAPADVLKHAAPEILGEHLPRPLWAKLLEACLAAKKVDAQLVVDSIGVRTLCAYLPERIMWACLAEVAARTLGKSILGAPPPSATSASATSASATSASATSVTLPRTVTPAPRPTTPPVGTPIPAAPPTRSGGPTWSTLGDLGNETGAGPRAETQPGKAGAGTAEHRDVAREAPRETKAPATGARNTGAGASSRRPQAQAGATSRSSPAGTPSSGNGTVTAHRAPTKGGDAPLPRASTANYEAKTEAPAAADDLIVEDSDIDQLDAMIDWAIDEPSTNVDDDKRR